MSKHAHPSPSAAATESLSAAREQLDLVRHSIAEFDQQIRVTDEMIEGLAILRDGVGQLSAHLTVAGNENPDTRLGSSLIACCTGLHIVLTNWGRRLQLDKNQLAANKSYNENLVRMAETGLVLPR